MSLREAQREIPLVESAEPDKGQIDNIVQMGKPSSKTKKSDSPFGRNLKALLASKKISQAQCCAMTGLPRATLNQWLYSSGVPRRIDEAHRVISLLDPTADFLVMLGLPPAKTAAVQLPEDLARDGFEVDSHPEGDFAGLFYVQMRRVRKKPSGGESK
jgi:transcriptional regulator with XRE-family HTH domain